MIDFLRKLFHRSQINVAHPRDPILADWLGSRGNTEAGVNIDPDQAIRLTAVYACVRILTGAIASLPLNVYRRLDGDGREIDRKNYLYKVLHESPNTWQTSYEYRELMGLHLFMRGNAYAKIIPSQTRPVQYLIPLNPDRVRPFWTDDTHTRCAYAYQPDQGESEIILQEEMHHIRGMGFDGLEGLSPISYLRESLGLTAASEQFGSRFFGSGTTIGGTLEHPGELGDTALERLRKQFQDRHQGLERSHKPLILEDGMKWKAMGVTPEESQFLETRKFQVSEICRIFGIPPHMIADVEKTSSWGPGIETQGIGFVTWSLMPWLTREEQAMDRDLLTDSGRRTHFTEYDTRALMRGDQKGRAEYYTKMFAVGSMNANTIRRYEGENPIENGDTYYVPANMLEVGARDDVEQNQEPADDERFRKFYMEQFRSSLERLVACETKALTRAIAGDDIHAVEAKINDFYSGIDTFVNRHFDALIKNRIDEFCNGWVKDSLSDVLDVIQRDDWRDRMNLMIQQWQSEKVSASFEQYADSAWMEYTK